MALEDLFDRYCDAWNEPSDAGRAAAVADVWAAGGVYSDPSVEAAGADALLAHIAATRASLPPFRIVRTSAIDQHHDTARFSWSAVQEDGTVLVAGIDFVLLDAARERITRIAGFFGPLDTAEHRV